MNGTKIKVHREEFHTRITVILRQKNRVFVPMPIPKIFRKDAFFSIRFVPNGVSCLLMSKCIAYIHSHPKLFDSILFPRQFYNNRFLPNVEFGNLYI